MKKILLLIIVLLSVNRIMAQWTLVDNNVDYYDDIHYKSPCILVTKNTSPRGLLVSCDYSDNFSLVSYPGFDNGINNIKSYGDTILCSAQQKIFYSINDGVTWNLLLDSTNKCGSFLIHGNYLYKGAIPFFDVSMKRISMNTGVGISLSLPVQQTNTTSLYGYGNEIYTGVYAGNPYDGYLYRSTDNGITWEELAHYPPTLPFISGHMVNAIYKVDMNTIIIAGTFGIGKSVNNGAGFTYFDIVSSYWQTKAYCFDYSNGFSVLGCDSGAFISYDTATTWHYFNDGFSDSTIVYQIKKIENYIYAVTDHGLWKRPWSDAAGIQQIAKESEILIFPTVTSDKVNIKLNGNTTLKTQIMLYDCLGKQVYYNSYKTNEIQVNVSELKQGIYFIKIFNSDFQKTGKIVVQ